MARFKNLLSKNNIIITILLILFLFSLWFLKQNLNLFSLPILDNLIEMNSPVQSFMDQNKNTYVIDDSYYRLLRLNDKGELDLILNGGSTAKEGFYMCCGAAIDDEGNIYIIDVDPMDDGAKVAREGIVKYDKNGNFIKNILEYDYQEIAQKDYSQLPFINGNLISIREIKGKIYYAYLRKNAILIYSIDDDVPELKADITFPLATEKIINLSIADDGRSILCTTKKGRIIRAGKTGIETIYRGHGKLGEEKISVPWNVLEHDGKVFFTDRGDRTIRELLPDGNKLVADYSGKADDTGLEGSPIYISLSVSKDGDILATDTFSLITLNEDGSGYRKIDTIICASKERNMKYLLYCLVFFWIIVFAYLLIKIIRKINFFNISETVKTGLIIFTVSGVISLSVGFCMISNFNATINQQLDINLQNSASLIELFLDGDCFSNMNDLDDCENESYKKLTDKMNRLLEGSADKGQNLYYVFYMTDGKTVYQSIDYMKGCGLLTPMDTAYKDSYYESVIRDGKQEKVDIFQDSTGVWTYIVSPIYNSKGEAVAALELGSNLSILERTRKNFIYKTIINILVITIILFLFFTEALFLVRVFKEKRDNKGEISADREAFLLARPFTFILFIADFIPSAFIPIYVEKLYTADCILPKGLAMALPLSAGMLASAIFAVVAGYLKDKLRLKKIFYIGSFFAIIGFASCGLSPDIWFLTVSKFVAGIGMGFLGVACTTMIAEQENEEDVSKGFSDHYASYYSACNIGCVLGGGIVTIFDYRIAFFCAAAFSLLGFLLVKFLLKQERRVEQAEKEIGDTEKVEEQSQISLGRFLVNLRSCSFLFTIFMPYLIASYFLFYFFPLYASEQGLSENFISYVFLVNGLFVVYLGPVISEWVEENLGSFFGTFIGSLLCVGAYFIFICDQSLTTAIITVLCLGIADSFAFTMQATHYTGLRCAKQFGIAKANGIMNTVEHGSTTLAPFVFGGALVLGNALGLSVIAIGMGAGALFFLLFGRDK